MLSLSRALAGRAASLLLLDELSLGLAPTIVVQLFAKIAELRDGGKSILLVEQFAHAALKIADRAGVMVRGRLTRLGPAEEFARDDAGRAREPLLRQRGRAMRVVGKRVIVTGGASGIGEASVRRFVEEGAAVAILDLDDVRGQALAAELAGSGTVLYRKVDVTRDAQVREAIDEVSLALGGLDVLHANAGVARAGSAVEHTEEEWDLVYAVNVKAPWLCAKHAIPHLLDAGGGSIVITGSTSGLLGFPGVIAYTSSKGAVINLTRSLALEHAEQGIRVNCVCPGHIDTPMSRAHFEDPNDPSALAAGFGMLAAQLPVNRMGTAAEVAAFCVFLASDDAGFCTGGIYVCDGGLTAQ